MAFTMGQERAAAVPLLNHIHNTTNVDHTIAFIPGIAGSQLVAAGDPLCFTPPNASSTALTVQQDGNVSATTMSFTIDARYTHYPRFAGVATTMVDPAADKSVAAARVALQVSGIAFMISTKEVKARDVLIIAPLTATTGIDADRAGPAQGNRFDPALFAARGRATADGRNVFRVCPLRDMGRFLLVDGGGCLHAQNLLGSMVGFAVKPSEAGKAVEVLLL